MNTILMRRFRLVEDGNHYDVVEAESAEAALKIAVGNVDAANYSLDWNGDRTQWVEVNVCEVDDDDKIIEGGDGASETVEVEPEAPDCHGIVDDVKRDDHDWQSPYGVLGGLKENPGVFGHGGGVIITEVCASCGIYRETDTWAQNPVNGVQGLTSVEYRDADDASSAWAKSLVPMPDDEAREDLES